jgi:hypothetical protein
MPGSTRTTDLDMAAYYLDEAGRRGLNIRCTVEVSGTGNRDCVFAFDDPHDLIPELEQSWASSVQASYSGCVRALLKSVHQVRKRRVKQGAPHG